jgi:hypothetical protein
MRKSPTRHPHSLFLDPVHALSYMTKMVFIDVIVHNIEMVIALGYAGGPI